MKNNNLRKDILKKLVNSKINTNQDINLDKRNNIISPFKENNYLENEKKNLASKIDQLNKINNKIKNKELLKKITDLNKKVSHNDKYILSEKTQKILEKINKNDLKDSLYFNCFKFSIKCNIKLEDKYINYSYIFSSLDSTIYWLKIYDKSSFLDNINSTMYNKYKIRINEKTIKQILYLFPKSYEISKSINEKNKSVQLNLTFPHIRNLPITKSYLEIRKSVFNNLLLNFNKEKHDNYWLENNLKLGKYYKKFNKWHKNFIAPDIPISNELNFNTLELNNNNILEKLEIDTKKDNNKAIFNKIENDIFKGNYNLKGIELKNKILEMVEQKEEVIKQSEANKVDNKFSYEKWKSICEFLKMYYLSRKVFSMFYENVINYTLKNCKFISSKIEIESYLEKLVEHLPFWLEKVTLKNQSFLKLKKGIQFNQVLERLNKIN